MLSFSLDACEEPFHRWSCRPTPCIAGNHWLDVIVRDIFAEIQDKAVALLLFKIRPEGHAFSFCRSRKYPSCTYWPYASLSSYIIYSTVDMG